MQESLQHSLAPNQVQRVFFSAANVDALQEGLRYGVYRASGGRHVIGRQSDMELGLIMRSVYLQYGRNEARDVLAQVRELNAQVLQFAVPRVASEVDAYVHYRNDIERLPQPMERGQLATSKGDRTLIMRPGF